MGETFAWFEMIGRNYSVGLNYGRAFELTQSIFIVRFSGSFLLLFLKFMEFWVMVHDFCAFNDFLTFAAFGYIKVIMHCFTPPFAD